MSEKKPLNNPADEKEKLPVNELELKLEQPIGSLLNEEQLERVVVSVTQAITQEAFSGPVAHPKHMREYEKILPGSAERIFAMAESAQKHNQNIDRLFLDASLKISLRGTHLGFVVLILLVFGAMYAGMNENNILASLLLGTGLVGGAAKLLHGRGKGDDKSD